MNCIVDSMGNCLHSLKKGADTMKDFLNTANKKHLVKPHSKMTLKIKMIFLITLLITGMFLILGLLINYLFTNTLEESMGEQALNVAESVAHIPELIQAFEDEDPASTIQPIASDIREATGAEFIVVGNKEEIRYSHPNHSQIGKKMVGEDNHRALALGESYVSTALGSLGQSLRGKVPVLSNNGEIIGVVSVGFLAKDVENVIQAHSKEIWLVLIIIGLIGIIGATFVSNYIKRILFGLEPEEISHLLLQKETILQSTHEGIIAVNQKGTITLINESAQKLLFDGESIHYIGTQISDVLPESQLPEVLKDGQSQFNREMQVRSVSILVNRVPIYYENMLIGAVATFRDKTEMEMLTMELTRVKQYAEALRAQTHEFSNKLSIIFGLLQLKHTKEAIEFIKKESNLQQEWIRIVIEKISDPLLSALILGKLNQASERQISLSIHPDSQLTAHMSDRKREALLTALGNVIDNAMDAVQLKIRTERKISIFFTDLGDDVLMEVDDSGSGVSLDDMEEIFHQGFSTKKGYHRGVGLALSKQIISEVNGDIFLEETDLGGACFVITIPKFED